MPTIHSLNISITEMSYDEAHERILQTRALRRQRVEKKARLKKEASTVKKVTKAKKVTSANAFDNMTQEEKVKLLKLQLAKKLEV